MKASTAFLAVGALAFASCGSDEPDELGSESRPSSSLDGSIVTLEPSGDAVAELSCLPLASDEWSMPVDFADSDHEMTLASNGETMLALGQSAAGIGGYRSTDGLAWKVTDDLPEMWVGGPIIDAAGGPVGFVTVGVTEPRDTQHGLIATPVVVFSPDGASWERINPESLPQSELRWFTGVFAGPEGFIVVGTEADTERLPTFVWYSADGTTWSDTDLEVGEGPVAVTSTQEGWMVLSSDADSSGDAPSRVWTSANGVNWTELEVERAAPARALFRYLGTSPLLLHDDALVLVLAGASAGDPEPRSPTVWVSTDDGITWIERTVWNDPDQAGFQIRDTAVTETGLFLAGYQDRLGERGAEFVHYSADGISWDHCWTDPVEFMAIEPLNDTLVAITGSGIVTTWTEP